jgi:sugar phosphate isomerase/epimerase
MTRRTLLAAAFARRAAEDRLGIMCQFPADEAGARKALDAARDAGFRRAQINFPWTRVTAEYLRALPRWLKDAGLAADVLSAYVNCADPANVIMDTRAGDFDRALDYAPEIGARRLIAWTGGYGRGLMTADPRNFASGAHDAIARFIEPRLKRLEANRLTLALETYITLACPDAPTLRALLDRLPRSVGAVLDPPNLTPIERYPARDEELRAMFTHLAGRIGVVHLKDFRLNPDGNTYALPGPLAGEMNYPLFLKLCAALPQDMPIIAEHIGPAEFAATRTKLLPLLLTAGL